MKKEGRSHFLYKLALFTLPFWLILILIGVISLLEDQDKGSGTVFFGIGIMFVTLTLTILIEFFFEKRGRVLDTPKEFSIRQEHIANIGSKTNDVAIRGIENLRARGWLTDGTLQRTKYSGANWTGADLSGADLRDTELLDVDLKDAVLNEANFEGATLTDGQHRNIKLPHTLPSSMKLSSVRAERIDLRE